MSRRHPFGSRRAVAAGIGVLLAAIGALTLPGPVQAAQSALSATCAAGPDATEWVVTWTVTPEGTGSFRLAQIQTTPAESGLNVDPPDQFPYPGGEPLELEQRVPADASAASLNAVLQWDTGQEKPVSAEVAIPEDCEAPESPDLIRGTSLSCTGLTITIENSSDDPMTLRFEPSRGDPLNVEVAAGESAIVEFPASPGLSVDVLHDGRSIVDASEPIEVRPAEWEQQRCHEDDDGEGGGLPATGLSITLAVVGALVLLAVGTGLYLTARRRRITFTA